MMIQYYFYFVCSEEELMYSGIDSNSSVSYSNRSPLIACRYINRTLIHAGLVLLQGPLITSNSVAVCFPMEIKIKM